MQEERITRVHEQRLVQMSRLHLAALKLVSPENWSGRLSFRSVLDGRVTNNGVAPQKAEQHPSATIGGRADGRRNHIARKQYQPVGALHRHGRDC